jgi:hypothetical protein
MKLVSTFALGLALALGAAATVATTATPAAAQKKQKAAKPQLSDGVRTALAAAQEALKKEDLATAEAQLNTALPLVQSPDEQFFVGSIRYDLARKQKNTKAQAESIKMMLDSGKVEAANQPSFYAVHGGLSYELKDYAAAEASLQQAINLGFPDVNVYAQLVEAQAKLNKQAAAVTTLQAAADKQKAAGQKLPAEWWGRGISIAYNAKLYPQTTAMQMQLLRDYPTKDNWRDAIILYRDINKVDADYEIDLMRLLRTTGAMKGEGDYFSIIELTYIKFPGEATAVIQEGIAAGMLNASNSSLQGFRQTAQQRLGPDKADLPGADKAARVAKNGVPARGTADSYMGYGEFAKAADLYKVALEKGGVDVNAVNTRLGMALARAGDYAGAKQALAQVTGPRKTLADLWSIWIDQKQAGAAVPPAA